MVKRKIQSTTPSSPNDSLVLSYLDLRKAIGIIGISLPFVLAFGKIIFQGGGIESSVSSYYYTTMRDVFVASLCALGIFLMTYRGYEFIDNVAGKFAAVFAIGTALFPTSPINASASQIFIGKLHIILALSLFLTLAFFSLVLFRKTNPNKPPTDQKVKRNIIYTVCGYGMLLCISLMIFGVFLGRYIPSDSPIIALKPIFWLEAITIVLFGISWFVKGEAILKDV